MKFQKMRYLRLSALALIASLFLSGCSLSGIPDEAPNIVWITSEDNSIHYMDLFDPHGASTPSIEKLAEQGVIFNNAFSNAPVCSAARSTLISGCYGPRIASHYHRKIRIVPMPETVEMFPAYLRRAGYYTTNNSKEDYNLIKAEDVWDESSKNSSWRNRAEGQPFFHVFNIGTTHEGRLHFTKEQMMNEKTETDPASCFIQPNHPQSEVFRYTNARYRDRIMEMDLQVAEVVTELEKDGLLGNTFIFYFGDHGGVLPGSKGYLAETGLHIPLVIYIPPKYEKMVDIEPGSRTDGFVSFIDFGATVLNLAGVDIPEGIDGKPFMGPGISAENLDQREETFSYADRFDEKYDMVRALRKGDYKYVRNYQPFYFEGLMNNYRYKQLAYAEWRALFNAGELNDVQSSFFLPKPAEALYDISKDPFETKNLAIDPEYADILVKLRNNLNSRLKEMPDLSFYPEHFLIKNAFDNPVGFGEKHKSEILEYINIADLMLLDFETAKTGIEKALAADDPWKRYWGLIVCSTFGESAKELLLLIETVSENDPELINKVRAAEYMGLSGIKNPSEIITESLYRADDPTEALLILNSIVLLRDCQHKYSIDIQTDLIPEAIKSDKLVLQRLKYLDVDS